MHLRHPKISYRLHVSHKTCHFSKAHYFQHVMEWVWIATLYDGKCFNPPITKKKKPNSSDYIRSCQKAGRYNCNKYLPRTSPKNRIPSEITILASSRSRTYSRLSRKQSPRQTSPARTQSSNNRYKQPQVIPHGLSSLQSTSPILLCRKFPHLHVGDTNTLFHGPINRNQTIYDGSN